MLFGAEGMVGGALDVRELYPCPGPVPLSEKRNRNTALPLARKGMLQQSEAYRHSCHWAQSSQYRKFPVE